MFFVTPSNLLLVIKLISDLWQQDRINREAHQMADRALKIYEKACGFLEDFNDMGKAITKAAAEWEGARTKLTGAGGLVAQGKTLQGMLGNKVKKSIPEPLLKNIAITDVKTNTTSTE